MNLTTRTIPKKGESRTLLTQWSDSSNEYIPVVIQTNQVGAIHLICPLGDHHKKAIDKASELLRKKGYKIHRVNVETKVYEVEWDGKKIKNRKVL